MFQHVVTSLQIQVATSPILNCYNLTKLIGLFQVVDKLQQASKLDNMQHVCGIFGAVVQVIAITVAVICIPCLALPVLIEIVICLYIVYRMIPLRQN